MLEIKMIDGEFRAKGIFDMGYMGKFVNEDFSGEIILPIEDDPLYWDLVKERFDVEHTSEDEIARFLTRYFNDFEEKVQKNIKRVNDNFLVNVFNDLAACGYPFWESAEITVSNAMPKCDIEDEDLLYKSIYKPVETEMSNLVNAFWNSPNDGSVEKPDAEEALRRMFPMFDFDAFIKMLVPDCLSLQERGIAFQCSDSLDSYHTIACAAYDELDEKLTFTDWHNH